MYSRVSKLVLKVATGDSAISFSGVCHVSHENQATACPSGAVGKEISGIPIAA